MGLLISTIHLMEYHGIEQSDIIENLELCQTYSDCFIHGESLLLLMGDRRKIKGEGLSE